jgi:hypothetical protein
MGYTICPICPDLFTRKEEDCTLIKLIVYIDDYLQKIIKTRISMPHGKLIVTKFLKAAGIKRRNIQQGSIVPTSFILTYKDLTTTSDKYSLMQ